MAARTGDRRAMLRQATIAEIRATARRLLVDKGPAAVTINAIAAQMGMSGPAVYHYFAGHDALVGAMTADFFEELAAEIERARQTAADTPSQRLLAICRAMHNWATAHPVECRWIFASPIALPNRDPESPRHQAGRRFEQIFLEEFAALWETHQFPTPDLNELSPNHQQQLRNYAATTQPSLPPEVAHVFLTCWIRLHGLLCLEALHQLDFAYTDLTPVFEDCLRDIWTTLDLPYEPPNT